MKTIELKREDVHTGDLILVNKRTPILKGADESQLGIISGFSHKHNEVLLRERVILILNHILHLLRGNGRIVPVSGYRSFEEQHRIFHESMIENGEAFTRKYVALPNCSEHQTGLAIDLGKNSGDIDFIRPDFPYNGICQRFRELSLQYGFIERYPKGKEKVTGIGWEPWHFRYVGRPHAALMKQHGFVLEEYHEYIKRRTSMEQPIRYAHKSSCYDICYVPAEEGITAIQIPSGQQCRVSGNNMDGFIITTRRSKHAAEKRIQRN